MPSLDVNGVSLYYEEKGNGDPLIFCHGIPTDYRAWNLQTEFFSKGFRTISYSRRYASPNARNGDVSDSTIANNADDLKGLIAKLGLGSVHLVGHSYGGFTAAYLASEHPELIRSLVLVEPAIATLLVEDETSSAQMLGLLFRSPSVALSARRFQNGSLRPSLAALDAGQTERAVELNVDGVQDRRGAFGAMPEAVRTMMLDNARTIAELRTKFPAFRERAPRISSRTLVINGTDSALWLRRIGQLTTTAIPKCQHVSVASARHFPHFENPSEFNGRVSDFLGEPVRA
jgi:non-heme chloroperoxidase